MNVVAQNNFIQLLSQCTHTFLNMYEMRQLRMVNKEYRIIAHTLMYKHVRKQYPHYRPECARTKAAKKTVLWVVAQLYPDPSGIAGTLTMSATCAVEYFRLTRRDVQTIKRRIATELHATAADGVWQRNVPPYIDDFMNGLKLPIADVIGASLGRFRRGVKQMRKNKRELRKERKARVQRRKADATTKRASYMSGLCYR